MPADRIDEIPQLRARGFFIPVTHPVTGRNVLKIALPPLRGRMGDLEILCEHILEQIGRRNGTLPRELDRAANYTVAEIGTWASDLGLAPRYSAAIEQALDEMLLNALFAAPRSASGGPDARRRAQSSTNASISPTGTTRLTMPMRSASVAEMMSPKNASSFALCRPMRRGSNQLPP